MINFILIAIIGYLILAVVSVLDKMILTSSVGSPASYAFYSTIFLAAAFVFIPFSQSISWSGFGIALISGLSFGFSLWAMFAALKRGEATHMVPFIGAVTAIFTYWLSSPFLGEKISDIRFAGIFLLIIASLMFAHDKGASMKKLHTGFLFAIGAGILMAISNISTKYFFDQYDFITGIAWTKGLVFLVGIVALALPSVRMEFIQRRQSSVSENKKSLRLIVTDKVLGLVGVGLLQYAIAIGSVTIVSAMVGLQYGLLLLITIFMTLFAPKIFREQFDNKEISLQILAIFFAVAGTILIA